MPSPGDENPGFGPKGYYGAPAPLLIKINNRFGQCCIVYRSSVGVPVLQAQTATADENVTGLVSAS